MKICAISDTHGQKVEIPECDLLIHCGDVSPMKDHDVWTQEEYLFDEFIPWLKSLPAKNIVFIAGNHDFYLESLAKAHMECKVTKEIGDHIHYLRDTATSIDGKVIHGTPWIPKLAAWAFYAKDDVAGNMFMAIPNEAEILISHGPPHGSCDRIEEYGDTRHLGSMPLRAAIITKQPGIVLCGHIHSGLHEWVNHEFTASTRVRNVSLLDEQYHMAYEPLVFEA